MTIPFKTASAQMFSVRDEKPRRTFSSRAIYVGWQPADFNFKGDPQTDGSARFAFTDPMLQFRMETFGLQLYLGFGSGLTGMSNVSVFNAGAVAEQLFPLIQSHRFALQLPLLVHTDLTSVRSDRVSGEPFEQSTLQVGTGIRTRMRLGDAIQITTHVKPEYGYSLSTGSTFTGQIFEWGAGVRLHWSGLLIGNGLSLGYEYGFKRYDIEVNRFDYNLRSHTLMLGIMF